MSDSLDPTDCSLPASSVHEILQSRIQEWVAISFSRGSSQPRDGIQAFSISCIVRQVLYHCVTWEAPWSSTGAAAAAAKSRLTLCDPIDSSPPGSPIPGILQGRTVEWVAISFSSEWKWKVKVKSLSCVLLLSNPMDCSPPGSSIHGIFPGNSTRVGCHCLLPDQAQCSQERNISSNTSCLRRWVIYLYFVRETLTNKKWNHIKY